MDLHFAMHPNRKKHCRKFHGYKYKAMHAVAQGNRRVLVAHLAAGELLEMSVQQEGSPQGSRASPSPACAQPEPPLTAQTPSSALEQHSSALPIPVYPEWELPVIFYNKFVYIFVIYTDI